MVNPDKEGMSPGAACGEIVGFVKQSRCRATQESVDQLIDGLSSYWCGICLRSLAPSAGDTLFYLTTRRQDINRDIRYLSTIRKLIAKIEKNSGGLSCGNAWVDKVRKMKW